MRINQGTYPDSLGAAIKVDGQYVEIVEGYTMIDGVWVPWDVPTQGDQDLSAAIGKKKLDGLILDLFFRPD
ncbi:hypothetical protein D3C78_1043450 [compost metagenome]